jgi:hypothetical protein
MELNLWRQIQESEFSDERGVKKIFVALLRYLSMLSDLRHHYQCILREYQDTQSAEEYEKEVRSLVIKGMAQDERKLMLLLKKKSDVREAEMRIQEIDSVLESTRRIESILRSILDCIRIELKLSFEGHE